MVPDVRTFITNQRMQQLKKQVQSLEKHQEKLEDELKLIEEKYEAKKKKVVESSDEFQTQLKSVCSFGVSKSPPSPL